MASGSTKGGGGRKSGSGKGSPAKSRLKSILQRIANRKSSYDASEVPF